MKKEKVASQSQSQTPSLKEFFWKHKGPSVDDKKYTVKDAIIPNRFSFYEDEEIQVRINNGKK